jgi:hypothetical protein
MRLRLAFVGTVLFARSAPNVGSPRPGQWPSAAENDSWVCLVGGGPSV